MFNNNFKIMIVDDEVEIAEGIATTLSVLTGYECLPYSNSLQALASFKKNPCQLVLTDLTMPGISGFDLAVQIKKIEHSTDIIVITAHKSPDVVKIAHQVGAADIFYKPMNIEDLEQAVGRSYQKFLTWQNRFQEVTYATL